MLNIGNKIYRNLQEQVGYNTECIKKLSEAIDGITIEDKLVLIDSDSGTFTDEELVILSGPLAFISNGSRVWMKDSETLVEFVFKAIDIKADEVGSAYFNIGGSKIVVNREYGLYNTSSDTIITVYSKSQIDSIVSNIMAVKANESDLVSGLALKADKSGQAFTGPITAPSIIQDMNGYSYTKEADSANLSSSDIYAGAVINGNKVTFVLFTTITRLSSYNGDKRLGYFRMPNDVLNKLFPFTIGSITNYLDVKTVVAEDSTNLDAPKNITFHITKGANAIYFNIRGWNTLTQSTPYLVRLETTFLLSDNLAQ